MKESQHKAKIKWEAQHPKSLRTEGWQLSCRDASAPYGHGHTSEPGPASPHPTSPHQAVPPAPAGRCLCPPPGGRPQPHCGPRPLPPACHQASPHPHTPPLDLALPQAVPLPHRQLQARPEALSPAQALGRAGPGGGGRPALPCPRRHRPRGRWGPLCPRGQPGGRGEGGRRINSIVVRRAGLPAPQASSPR